MNDEASARVSMPQTEQEAADRAVDRSALLDGEDPDSRHLDDAEHWIAVYTELIAFKETVLTSTAEEMADMEHAEARSEAKHVDVKVLRAELDRFRKRLIFWQQRHIELCREGGS